MNIAGMLRGDRLLKPTGFSTPDILCTRASQCRFVA
jgi:hypothetical protein